MADEKPYNISIEVKAQLEEIQKLLDELRSISAEMSKINGQTFSAVSMSAAELSKTGKDLAKALVSQRIASEEFNKMLGKTGSGLENAKEKTKKFKDEVDGTKNSITGFYMELGAMAARMVTHLPSAVTATIQAFGQQEMVLQKLSAAVRTNGGNVSEVLPIMQQFASDIQAITTYGDEQVHSMMAMATSMGVNAGQMDIVMRSAIGLSTALGMDVTTATKAAASAIQGKTGMLQEYIPSLVKCKTEEEKLTQVQRLSESGFAQAEAAANTLDGKLKQAANAWGDLAEVAGETFAPVAVEVAGALKSVCEWFTRNSELTQILIGSLTSLAVGFAFSKIGGLANVASLFKLVASGMTGAKTASDALNVSLKANPLGIAMTAISGLGLIISSVSKSSEDLYNKNIEKSKEYRDSLDEEIAELEKWGVSVENNKKRTAEIKAEIAKLNAENMNLIPKASIGGFQKVSDSNLEIYQNNIAKIESLKKVLEAYSDVEGLGAKNTKQHAAALEAEKKILAESEKEMRAAKSEAEALKVIKEKLAETEKEVSRLTAEQKSGAWADKDREANANRLRQARLELVELGKKELEQNLKIAASKYDSLKTAELNKQRDLERQIAGAILGGNSEKAKSLKLELEESKIQESKYSTISSYIAERKAEIKTEEDLKRVKAEAARHANTTLALERQKSESDRFLAEKAEKTKETQRSLETDILRLRAAGNEAGAKELEQKLRISQMASEIFENSRKEGMSREKLSKLSEDAKKDAAERYKLEKEITDEAERQNLAKDNQAKIEDILLTNKIEQLKAEGKLAEAQSLEDERSIKRTLSGMKGLSEEQKKSLAETMRQTNAYREQQQNKSAAGDARTPGTGSTAASSLRTSSPPKTGGKEDGRPATVSEKSAGYYDEWKAAGGSRSGISWTDFRKQKQAQESKQSNGKKQPSSSAYSSQSVSILDNIEERSWAMANGVVFKDNNPPKTATPNVGGAVNDASKSTSNDFRTRQTLKPAETSLKKKAALPTLNNKLDSMGVKSEETTENNSAQSLGDIAASVRTLCEDIKSLKTTVTALAEKRNK